jgi:prepilin signal peptidase PulO-like enzyme (type II secretory pathway)
MTESIIFLLYSSYVDIKHRSVSVIACCVALFFLLVVCFNTKSIDPAFNALLGFWIIYFMAEFCEKFLRIEVGGGDGKVIAFVCGVSGLLIGISTFVLAMLMYKTTEHPNKVAFVPYLLVSFLLISIFNSYLIH